MTVIYYCALALGTLILHRAEGQYLHIATINHHLQYKNACY